MGYSRDVQKKTFSVAEEMSLLDLRKEKYSLSLELEVPETVHNME